MLISLLNNSRETGGYNKTFQRISSPLSSGAQCFETILLFFLGPQKICAGFVQSVQLISAFLGRDWSSYSPPLTTWHSKDDSLAVVDAGSRKFLILFLFTFTGEVVRKDFRSINSQISVLIGRNELVGRFR